MAEHVAGAFCGSASEATLQPWVAERNGAKFTRVKLWQLEKETLCKQYVLNQSHISLHCVKTPETMQTHAFRNTVLRGVIWVLAAPMILKLKKNASAGART